MLHPRTVCVQNRMVRIVHVITASRLSIGN
jgi:hypothetical protein